MLLCVYIAISTCIPVCMFEYIHMYMYMDHVMYSPKTTIPIISPFVDEQSDFEFCSGAVVSIGIGSTVLNGSTVLIGSIVLTGSGRHIYTKQKVR